jgi:hypothetical protein
MQLGKVLADADDGDAKGARQRLVASGPRDLSV